MFDADGVPVGEVHGALAILGELSLQHRLVPGVRRPFDQATLFKVLEYGRHGLRCDEAGAGQRRRGHARVPRQSQQSGVLGDGEVGHLHCGALGSHQGVLDALDVQAEADLRRHVHGGDSIAPNTDEPWTKYQCVDIKQGMNHEPYALRGKTILLTGATQGMGRHLALALAANGATLLLHGRDRARLAAVASEARAVDPGPPVRTYLADLADLGQVRSLADRVLATESRLDVLVNNAAVGGGTDPSGREMSRQGHELRFAVNHLAPYLLTCRLVPLLTASAPARVVNVASIGQVPIDFDNVMLEREYDGVRAYCQSKLAMIMATFDLAADFANDKITVNALHPAHLMDTQMVRQSGFTPAACLDEGMRPTLRLIADPALESVTGSYFDQLAEAVAHAQAYDPIARARLAALTQRLCAADG